jgi:hypothetical protein
MHCHNNLSTYSVMPVMCSYAKHQNLMLIYSVVIDQIRNKKFVHYCVLLTLYTTLTYLIRSSYTLTVSRLFFYLILIVLQTVGLLGRVTSSSQGLYLNTGQHKHRIDTYTYQTSMPCVEFEPMIPASERAKTVNASDLGSQHSHSQMVY